jgi:hypothetical protein
VDCIKADYPICCIPVNNNNDALAIMIYAIVTYNLNDQFEEMGKTKKKPIF